MKVSITDLANYIDAGSKIASEKDTEFFMYTKKDKLYLAFIHPQITYCKRINAEGDIADICLNLPIFKSMIKGKTGDAEIVTTNGAISIKGKGFKYTLDGTTKDTPTDVISTFFTKKGESTTFINVRQKILKALSSIKDRVTDTTLSVRVLGTGKTAKFLLVDNHHGLLITQTLTKDERYKSEEIVLPIDTFFKVLEVAASTEEVNFHQTDTEITVQTKSEYLQCKLKMTSNSNISFKMMEELIASKSKGQCEVKTEDFMQALATCRSIVASAPVELSTKKGDLTVSMQTGFSKTTEKVKSKDIVKSFSTSLNVTLLMEIASAMFENTLIKVHENATSLESSDPAVNMQGMCVAYVEEDD